MTHQEITKLLQTEMVPALGCTGPTAYALAAACCRPYLTAASEQIRIYVSPAFLKIGFGVATPGTSRPGIPIAVALGLIGGDHKLGLQVLEPATAEDMRAADKLVDSGIIQVLCDWEKKGVYVRAEVETKNETVLAVVEHTHDGISLIQVNGKTIYEKTIATGEGESNQERFMTIDEIFSYVENAPLKDIRFLLDGWKMNMALAQAALEQPFGLASGRAYLKEYWKARGVPEDLFDRPMDYLPDNAVERSKILVAAASDGRMGGCRLPAMAAMGDGNQGLTGTIPIGVAAQFLGADEETTCRALAMSCLMLFFVKMNIGRAAAFCLCAIAASAGVAAGLSYLRGMPRELICGAVKNVISPLAGMLCDGAKNGCALKMAVAVSTAMSACDLAQDGVQMGFYDGMCDNTLEETVACITSVANQSMDLLDRCMVEEILKKANRDAVD